MEENNKLQAPAALTPGKEPLVLMEQEPVRVPKLVWKLVGFEIRMLGYFRLPSIFVGRVAQSV
jgi:hypothetical protein